MVLDLDLNDPPSVEDQVPEQASITATSLADQELAAPVDPQGVDSSMQQQVVLNLRPASDGQFGSPIDVEAIEDEVEMFSSPRHFPQVGNRPRRNQPETVVLEEDSEHNLGEAGDTELRLSINGHNKRARNTANNKSGKFKFHDNLIYCLDKKRSRHMNPHPEPKEVKPKEPTEPTFSCPICLHAIVDACSTICGHIFCQKCIKETIQKLKKCPTCRKQLTKNNCHRVYLPI